MKRIMLVAVLGLAAANAQTIADPITVAAISAAHALWIACPWQDALPRVACGSVFGEPAQIESELDALMTSDGARPVVDWQGRDATSARSWILGSRIYFAVLAPVDAHALLLVFGWVPAR